MKSLKTLALVLACLTLSALATAAAAAGGQQAAQSNSNTNQNAQAQTASAQGNQNSSSNQNTSRAQDRDDQDEPSNPSRGDRPGANVTRTGRRGESRYRFELGVMPRYISNYFQTFDDFQTGATAVPVKSVYITTLSASAEYDFVREDDKTLTGGVRLRRNFFKDPDGADSTDIDVTLEYDFRPNRLRFAYFGTPRRLASVVSGRNVYSRVNGFNAEYSRRLTRQWRARGGYEFARDTFSEFTERNLSRHELSGDIRYQFSPYFTPGVGFEYLRGNAASENFSYTRPALVLLATSRISDVAYLSFRYRYSDRDYSTGVTTASNFGREDRRHDLSFYGTVNLGRGFSLFGFVYRTDNNSTRVTRSFNSYETGLGLFFRFP